MFESFKDHPLTKDLAELQALLIKFNTHAQDQIGKSIGVVTTKFLDEIQKEVGTLMNKIKGTLPNAQAAPTPEAESPPVARDTGEDTNIGGD